MVNSPFIVIFCSHNGASPLTGAIQYSTPCIISPGRDHPVSVLFYIDVSPRTCLHCNAEVFQEWQVVQVSSMFPRYSDMLWITIYGYLFLVLVVALIFFLHLNVIIVIFSFPCLYKKNIDNTDPDTK